MGQEEENDDEDEDEKEQHSSSCRAVTGKAGSRMKSVKNRKNAAEGEKGNR